jgi:hypothetical protein
MEARMPALVREALIVSLGSIILAAIIFRFSLSLVVPIIILILISAWISSTYGVEDRDR